MCLSYRLYEYYAILKVNNGFRLIDIIFRRSLGSGRLLLFIICLVFITLSILPQTYLLLSTIFILFNPFLPFNSIQVYLLVFNSTVPTSQHQHQPQFQILLEHLLEVEDGF